MIDVSVGFAAPAGEGYKAPMDRPKPYVIVLPCAGDLRQALHSAPPTVFVGRYPCATRAINLAGSISMGLPDRLVSTRSC